MRYSKIIYNPELSVRQNAKANHVSEAGIRYFIRVNSIDRRAERKIKIIKDCREYLEKHPGATWDELQKNTGHSLSTMRMYREKILSKEPVVEMTPVADKKRIVDIPDIYGAIVVNGFPYKIESVVDLENVMKLCYRKNEVDENAESVLSEVENGVVYFGVSPYIDAIKIGRTSLHRFEGGARQKELQTSFKGFHFVAYKITGSISEAKALEDELHKRFWNKHVEYEWFDLSDEDLREVYEEYDVELI